MKGKITLKQIKLGRILESKLRSKLENQSNKISKKDIVWITHNIENKEYIRYLHSISRYYNIKIIQPYKEKTADIDLKEFCRGILPSFDVGKFLQRFAEILKEKDQPSIIIDRPHFTADTLFHWIYLPAICYMQTDLTIEEFKDICLLAYFSPCSEDVGNILDKADDATKRLTEFKGLHILEDGLLPDDIESLNKQVKFHQDKSLYNPDNKKLIEIDLELIDIMEIIHDIWEKFKEVRDLLEPAAALWLENNLHILRIFSIFIRQLIVVYFTWLGLVANSIDMPEHVFRSKCGDLRSIIRNKYLIISRFDKNYPEITRLKIFELIDKMLKDIHQKKQPQP